MQNSRSSGNVPAAGSSEYSKSQLEASAAQKDNFFARKLEVCCHDKTAFPMPAGGKEGCCPSMQVPTAVR